MSLVQLQTSVTSRISLLTSREALKPETVVQVNSIEGPNLKGRNLYLLEVFPSEAVEYCQRTFNTILPTDSEIHRWRENADAILVREMIITAADIAACTRLKSIGKQGTGIDNIDQDACRAAGVKILNTPGVNASTVAELTLCLALSVARQIRPISVKQEQGLKVRKEHCCGLTLSNSNIGIMGMGAIGKHVARMFHAAFGSNIYAFDPFMPATAWADLPHIRVSTLDELLPQVDILSLHVPLTPDTRGCIALPQFKQMKTNAIVLNLARGGLIDEADLTTALEQNMIWGAGLDCHEEEPPTTQRYEKLWATGKVVSTPHIGATCASTQVKTAMTAVRNIQDYLGQLDV